jgi:hypothetical protein
LSREEVLLIDLGRPRLDDALRELADGGAERSVFRCEFEVQLRR